MAIKSDTFSRVELTDADAIRFVQHMREDKPNAQAKASYARGKKLLAQVLGTQAARPR
ncbi:hypothetical protein [Pseudomonas sp. RIT-PI-S]|uniref:hypothetical protein n=1 Tax=Pseudomonas sp. RIT-PI-S TaxID=3035295 RepID=UPI0021DA84F9|nr:hypothetical protein [Pseudomonas sp. RIT-PI-S]